MKKIETRRGISLVALIITIIVLVVLTGAVVITGINVPQQGQFAVFKNNISSMQDAVTMKMLNNTVNYREKNNENVKVGIGHSGTDYGITANGSDVSGQAQIVTQTQANSITNFEEFKTWIEQQ